MSPSPGRGTLTWTRLCYMEAYDLDMVGSEYGNEPLVSGSPLFGVFSFLHSNVDTGALWSRQCRVLFGGSADAVVRATLGFAGCDAPRAVSFWLTIGL